MEISLTNRGRIFLGIISIFVAVSPLFPTLFFILLPVVLLGYTISYLTLRKQIGTLDLNVKAKLRNSLLYRGEVDVIHVSISNNSDMITPFIRVEVELPIAMYYVESQKDHYLALPPKTKRHLNIPFLPSARGSFSIGPIKVALTDGLKLFESPLHYVEEIGVKVFPSRLGTNINPAQTLLTFSKLIGIFSTKSKGLGTDFHGLRDYIRGDPSKIVSWPASAKAGKLISKEFEEEKRLETYVIVQGGSSMRGKKFDFTLGVSLDIYQGILDQNQPCGYIYFDDEVRVHFDPSLSPRDKMKIWSSIFSLVPRDEYVSYTKLRNHIIKKRITNSLFIIIGDLERTSIEILGCIRGMILNKNKVLFLDVFGYRFSYQPNILDVSKDYGESQYGIFLKEILDPMIEHGEYLTAVNFKKQINRLGGVYGYFLGPGENVVTVINRSMFSHFGKLWRSI